MLLRSKVLSTSHWKYLIASQEHSIAREPKLVTGQKILSFIEPLAALVNI